MTVEHAEKLQFKPWEYMDRWEASVSPAKRLHAMEYASYLVLCSMESRTSDTGMSSWMALTNCEGYDLAVSELDGC